METTERTNVIKYNPVQFSEAVEKMNFIKNPLDELANAPSAVIFINLKCCSIRCCIPITCCCSCSGVCADFFRYNTIINTNGVQKYLFRNIAKIGCSICTTDKLSRFENCKSMALASKDQYSELDGGELFSEMVKDGGCFCCCCSVNFKVNIPGENRVAGIVKKRGCCSLWCSECCKEKKCCQDCCQATIYCCDILNANEEQFYTIYLIKCCCSCTPVDWCPHFTFMIRDQANNEVGRIDAERNCCNFNGICGNNFTYNIFFPANATPELKLTIINAVISIDLFDM